MTTYFTGTITPTNDDWSVSSIGTGATLYAFLTVGSRAEWSPLSEPKTVVYDPTNPNLSITLNTSLRPSGTWVWEVAVAFSATSDPQQAIFAGAWRGYEPDQETPLSLPATIVFNSSQLIKTTPASVAVANISALASVSPTLHGMVRTVSSEGGAVYRWDNTLGDWVYWRSISAYQFAPRKPAVEIDPTTDWFLPPPIYPSDSLSEGSPSVPIKYWMVNDGANEWTTGDGIDLQCAVSSDLSQGYLLSNLCNLTVLGLTDLTTGSLDTANTTISNVNVTYTWRDSDSWLFQLQNPIAASKALTVEVFLEYYKSQLNVPNGSLLQAIPLNTGKFSYQTLGFAGFEDWLTGLKLLPTIGGISDTGGAARIGNWTFSPTQAGVLTSSIIPQPNATKQVVINAQSRLVRIEDVGIAIDNQPTNTYRTEGIIGVIGTSPGVCTRSSAAVVTSTTGSIDVTINHPSIVNPSYPVIGGISSTNNVANIYIYLTISGITYRTLANVVPGNQIIPITSLGTQVAAIPDGSFANDLFLIPTPIVSDGTTIGSLPVGSNITCIIQYVYLTPNTVVSEIDMELAGMLRQQSDVLLKTQGFWGILTVSQLRQLDTTDYTGKEWGRVIIGNVSNLFKFDPTSTDTDNGVSVIKPDDRTGAGRYIDEIGASSQGILSMNTLTATSQTIVPGTGGNDINIDSSGSTHTINIPTVSSTKRGVLTSAMYNDLNGRQANWTASPGDINSILNKPSTFPPSAHQHAGEDITSGVLDPSRIPNLNANKITAGQFTSDRLPPINISNLEGIVLDTPTVGQVLKFDGTAWINQADEVAPPGSGIVSINGVNSSSQTLSPGTTGTDFNIGVTGSTHKFNIPTVGITGVTRGLLTATDWNTFNDRQSDWNATTGKSVILNKPSTFPPSSHNHDAAQITSGILDIARIPDLPASKITTGTLNIARLPSIALGNLSNVTLTNPTSGQGLVFNGTNWVNGTVSGGGGGGTGNIASLNQLTAADQTFVGTNITINSSGSVHTFSLAIADDTTTGLLSASSWNTFNNKQELITQSNAATIRDTLELKTGATRNISSGTDLPSGGIAGDIYFQIL